MAQYEISGERSYAASVEILCRRVKQQQPIATAVGGGGNSDGDKSKSESSSSSSLLELTLSCVCAAKDPLKKSFSTGA